MTLLDRRNALKLVVVAAVSVGAPSARALERDKNGYFLTGTGVRVKHVAFLSADLYVVSHYMTELPPQRSKQVVLDMDVDKAFSARILRDLGTKDVCDGFIEAFERNGFNDRAKIDRFLGPFAHDLKKGMLVRISYDHKARATTVSVQGQGTVSISGVDFMRATWAMWFGKTDQPELGDALISRIP